MYLVDAPEQLNDLNAVTFIRLSPIDAVPEMNSLQEADEQMPNYLEYSHFSGHLLQSLGNIIDVYLPILTAVEAQDSNNKASGGSAKNPATLSDSARSELGITLQKFSSHINQTLQQVTGDSKLKMPEVPYTDIMKASKDANFLKTITELSNEWVEVLVGTINSEIAKKPQGSGPMAEIEFWRGNALL